MENDKTYPNSLRKYRKARGLTQKEVAKVLGLKSASMISRWERGVSLPSVPNLFKLAVLYRTMADVRRRLVDIAQEKGIGAAKVKGDAARWISKRLRLAHSPLSPP